ncbi:DUF4352 domain-containing protein [Streptomyces sp. NPDC001380]|uniref:DUF4352 domain-containing protein n=1 Tax=Streptomyces sp. NPDC001380 TaxID=3364566 RepID=UPI0036B99DDC
MLRTTRSAAVVLSAALVALGATACNADTGESVSTAPKAAAADKAQGNGASRKAAPRKAAKVGDTISLKGMETTADVTVLKVVDRAKGADEFNTPDAGKRFVAVQFRIRNTGRKAYSDSPSNGAKVVDAEGQGFDSWIADTAAGPGFPADVHLAPGGTAKGFITFQVPKGARIDKVQFGMDSGFADQTGQWDVR